MVWPRYIIYFIGITLITWMLTHLEISYPGSLKLYVLASEGDTLGTSEFSPIEIMQPLVLVVCGALLAWVARYCPSQRPIAFPFGGLDRLIIENLWQLLIGIALALVIVYTYRARKRLRIAWFRVWPSPGIALWFAGAAILFVYVRFVGQEPLWQSILGDSYHRAATLAVEEFVELIGYFLWLIGTIEYAYQARAIAYRKPRPAAQRRRQKRRHEKEGTF
jgi:nitric oxide reductase large subunit